MPDTRIVQYGTALGSKTRVFFYVTDGSFVPVTGITSGSAGFALQRSIGGAAFATSSDLDATTWTEVGNGLYYASFRTLTINDINILFRTRFKCTASLETPGDSLLVVSNDPYAPIVQPLGVGTIASTTGTTTTLDSVTGVPATTDFHIGSLLVITGGTGAGQARVITAYTSGRVCTHAAWVTNPTSSSTYQVIPAACWMGGYALPEITGPSDAPATPTPQQALMLPYMAKRNKRTVEGGTAAAGKGRRIHNDANAAVLAGDLSDASGIGTDGKLTTAP